ncbi:MAG: hypothetical protein AB7N65_07040 [Vicinamibacterales bacterium]
MSQASLILTSVATGFFFCVWPLRMNQSGLPGAAALLVYALVAIATALAVATATPGTWPALRGEGLSIGLQASALNAAGVLLFMLMLSHAGRRDAPRLILIVVMSQTALTGVWAAYQAGSVEPRLLAGLVTALLTVWFLR